MMSKLKKHIAKDSVKIVVLALLSFGIFYLVLAQEDKSLTEPYTNTTNLPPECVEKQIHDELECKRYLDSLYSQPEPYYPPPTTTSTDPYYPPPPPEDTTEPYYPPEPEPYTESTPLLPPECVEKQIHDEFECKRFMESLTTNSTTEPYYPLLEPESYIGTATLPPECVEKQIHDELECKRYMESLYPKPEPYYPPAGDTTEPYYPPPGDDGVMTQECIANQIHDSVDCILFMKELERGSWEEGNYPDPNQYHVPYECQQEGIHDEFACREFLTGVRYERIQNEEVPLFMMPPECQEREIRDPEGCKALMESLYGAPRVTEDYFVGGPIIDFTEQLPPPCQENNIHDPIDCAEYMKGEFMYGPEMKGGQPTDFVPETPSMEYIPGFKPEYLPFECREQGFTTPEECEKFFMERSMPPICKEEGATTQEECESIITKRVMPPECLEKGALTESECDRVLHELFLPKSCEEAGAYDKASCATVIFEKHGRPVECENLDDSSCFRLIERDDVGQDFINRVEKEELPSSCRDSGATTFEDCEDLHAEKLVPKECVEAGIFSPEGCEKFLFEKFGGMKKEDVTAHMPPKCQEAGVTDPEDCRKLMEADLFPRECVEAGIQDSKDCRVFMELRHMPLACQKAEIRTRSECDEYLRKQYIAPICTMQGITDSEACNELVHNTIEDRVSCKGLTSEECELSVKKRHLGNILDAAQRVDNVDKVINAVAGDAGTIDLDALAEEDKDSYRMALDVLPIKGKKMRKLRAFKSQAHIEVSENDEVLSEPSVVIALDSDGDGLPDDVERRNGLNPFDNDSDGDGVFDKDELKNKKGIAPIDVAVATNQDIGQPRTEGEVDETLEVSSISELDVEEDEDGEGSKGIALTGKGKAGEVVTIYIYSDLPMVLTTTVDENGEWQYDFEEQINDGMHEVYVVVNDDTGKVIRKSNPLSFVISAARALTIQEAVAAGELDEVAEAMSELPPDVNVADRSGIEKLIKLFVLGAGMIMLIALMVVARIIKRKSSSRPE